LFLVALPYGAALPHQWQREPGGVHIGGAQRETPAALFQIVVGTN